MRLLLCLVVALVLAAPCTARSEDIIRVFRSESSRDPRTGFHDELFHAILEATRPDYGDYAFEIVQLDTSRDREIEELERGELINVAIMPADIRAERRIDPIRIPVYKGLLGYRLLFVHRDRLGAFSGLKTILDLKAMRMGLDAQWSITKALGPQGFTIVAGNCYDGLFKMLDMGRFDYFPRGLNEIYAEHALREDVFPELVIEPRLAFYIPLPSFIFVSPQHPRLRERIKTGWERILADGEYDALFNRRFGGILEKADLENRKIFYVYNKSLTAKTRRVMEKNGLALPGHMLQAN